MHALKKVPKKSAIPTKTATDSVPEFAAGRDLLLKTPKKPATNGNGKKEENGKNEVKPASAPSWRKQKLEEKPEIKAEVKTEVKEEKAAVLQWEPSKKVDKPQPEVLQWEPAKKTESTVSKPEEAKKPEVKLEKKEKPVVKPKSKPADKLPEKAEEKAVEKVVKKSVEKPAPKEQEKLVEEPAKKSIEIPAKGVSKVKNQPVVFPPEESKPKKQVEIPQEKQAQKPIVKPKTKTVEIPVKDPPKTEVTKPVKEVEAVTEPVAVAEPVEISATAELVKAEVVVEESAEIDESHLEENIVQAAVAKSEGQDKGKQESDEEELPQEIQRLTEDAKEMVRKMDERREKVLGMLENLEVKKTSPTVESALESVADKIAQDISEEVVKVKPESPTEQVDHEPHTKAEVKPKESPKVELDPDAPTNEVVKSPPETVAVAPVVPLFAGDSEEEEEEEDSEGLSAAPKSGLRLVVQQGAEQKASTTMETENLGSTSHSQVIATETTSKSIIEQKAETLQEVTPVNVATPVKEALPLKETIPVVEATPVKKVQVEEHAQMVGDDGVITVRVGEVVTELSAVSQGSPGRPTTVTTAPPPPPQMKAVPPGGIHKPSWPPQSGDRALHNPLANRNTSKIRVGPHNSWIQQESVSKIIKPSQPWTQGPVGVVVHEQHQLSESLAPEPRFAPPSSRSPERPKSITQSPQETKTVRFAESQEVERSGTFQTPPRTPGAVEDPKAQHQQMMSELLQRNKIQSQDERESSLRERQDGVQYSETSSRTQYSNQRVWPPPQQVEDRSADVKNDLSHEIPLHGGFRQQVEWPPNQEVAAVSFGPPVEGSGYTNVNGKVRSVLKQWPPPDHPVIQTPHDIIYGQTEISETDNYGDGQDYSAPVEFIPVQRDIRELAFSSNISNAVNKASTQVAGVKLEQNWSSSKTTKTTKTNSTPYVPSGPLDIAELLTPAGEPVTTIMRPQNNLTQWSSQNASSHNVGSQNVSTQNFSSHNQFDKLGSSYKPVAAPRAFTTRTDFSRSPVFKPEPQYAGAGTGGHGDIFIHTKTTDGSGTTENYQHFSSDQVPPNLGSTSANPEWGFRPLASGATDMSISGWSSLIPHKAEFFDTRNSNEVGTDFYSQHTSQKVVNQFEKLW